MSTDTQAKTTTKIKGNKVEQEVSSTSSTPQTKPQASCLPAQQIGDLPLPGSVAVRQNNVQVVTLLSRTVVWWEVRECTLSPGATWTSASVCPRDQGKPCPILSDGNTQTGVLTGNEDEVLPSDCRYNIYIWKVGCCCLIVDICACMHTCAHVVQCSNGTHNQELNWHTQSRTKLNRLYNSALSYLYSW